MYAVRLAPCSQQAYTLLESESTAKEPGLGVDQLQARVQPPCMHT